MSEAVEVPGLQVVFDAGDPARLAEFWALALGYQTEPPPPGWESWEAWAIAHDFPCERWNDSRAIIDPAGRRPRIYLQRVPEPKTAKNRVHLDVNVGSDRVSEKVAQLVTAGATVVAEIEHHVVLLDPEGNEFCVQ